MEQRGPNIARARFNFVMCKENSINIYADEKPITDPAVYKDAFERIEKELFVRQTMNAPMPASPKAADPLEPSEGGQIQEISTQRENQAIRFRS